jgi:hypothetical protein
MTKTVLRELSPATAGTAGEEPGKSIPEGHRQSVHIQQREIPFAPLDAADVSPVQTGLVAQFLLAPATSLARAAHTLAELAQNRFL